MNANLLFDKNSEPQPFPTSFLRDKKTGQVVHVMERVPRVTAYHGSSDETKTWDYITETVEGKEQKLGHNNALPDVSREEILKFEREYSRQKTA